MRLLLLLLLLLPVCCSCGRQDPNVLVTAPPCTSSSSNGYHTTPSVTAESCRPKDGLRRSDRLLLQQVMSPASSCVDLTRPVAANPSAQCLAAVSPLPYPSAQCLAAVSPLPNSILINVAVFCPTAGIPPSFSHPPSILLVLLTTAAAARVAPA